MFDDKMWVLSLYWVIKLAHEYKPIFLKNDRLLQKYYFSPFVLQEKTSSNNQKIQYTTDAKNTNPQGLFTQLFFSISFLRRLLDTISVSPHVCFILVLILISMFLR